MKTPVALVVTGVFLFQQERYMNIKDIVKNQNAHFVFYRDKSLFYETDYGFQFPVPISDTGSATLQNEEKAILLMRYIRKHMESTDKARKAQNESST